MRAAAYAASTPACPAPITTTSNVIARSRLLADTEPLEDVLQHVFARVRSHDLAKARTRPMQVREEELLGDSFLLRCCSRSRKVRARMFEQRTVTHVRNRARIAKRLPAPQRRDDRLSQRVETRSRRCRDTDSVLA